MLSVAARLSIRQEAPQPALIMINPWREQLQNACGSTAHQDGEVPLIWF